MSILQSVANLLSAPASIVIEAQLTANASARLV